MKITIESTTQIVEANGVKCRVWEGVTERGVKVPRDRRGRILGGIGILKWGSISPPAREQAAKPGVIFRSFPRTRWAKAPA